MKPGIQVGLGPGHAVLDGDLAPLHQREQAIFGPYLLWPNGWMHQDATWYGGRSQPRSHCDRWGPSSSKKGDGRSPHTNFQPMSIVAKGLDGSRCHLVGK